LIYVPTDQELTSDLYVDDTTRDQYLTFEVDGEDYGVSISDIKEIISICPITLVPETPEYVEGIINLRGDIIPVIEVRKRFGKPTREYDSHTCIVVIEHNIYTIGLIVDSVKEVMYIDSANVLPPPSAKLSHYNQFVRNIGRVGEEVKLLLDIEKFLNES